MLETLIDAFVGTWLWSMTWGLYHVPISLFVTIILLWRYAKKTLSSSLLWSWCAVLSSYAIFTFIVVVLLMYCVGYVYMPDDIPCCEPLTFGVHPAYGVALVYTCLELLFWRVTPLWRSLGPKKLWLITSCANGLASLVVFFSL